MSYERCAQPGCYRSAGRGSAWCHVHHGLVSSDTLCSIAGCASSPEPDSTFCTKHAMEEQ